MTGDVVALQPVQPTVYTHNIQSVLPSRFAARMIVVPPEKVESQDDDAAPFAETEGKSSAPVVHIADDKGALLIDYTYGSGSIVLLSDPYIVSNSGIKLNDNSARTQHSHHTGRADSFRRVSPGQRTDSKQFRRLLRRYASAFNRRVKWA